MSLVDPLVHYSCDVDMQSRINNYLCLLLLIQSIIVWQQEGKTILLFKSSNQFD